MANFDFSNLTPDCQLDALESVGIFPETGLLALNSYENRVYQFQASDRVRYVVKFYRPQRWSDAQILEDHQFSLELQEADIPVVAPLSFHGQTLLSWQDMRFALFPSVGGRQFEVDNLDQLAHVGQYLGRAHQIGAKYPFVARPTISIDEFVTQPLGVLRTWLPENLQEAFFAIADQVSAQIIAQYQPHTQAIRLHGDCHPGNILWRDGPQLVDLDDARMGPAIQDLWMLLNGDRAEQQIQLETLLEGYDSFASLSVQELKFIEPLRAMRMIHYMGWLARRWQDGAFRRAFPWFNSQQYWQNQILALKEQLSALYEPPLSLVLY
ncbi:serine/threonine protein kinase [Celerinatantimonas yamalensis]|uniref:Stress response kinase A n=1 Tax=Celerinatantimonas yamalensis TaxID=559956 RepID=A0ABW9GAQ1_9GAMM